MMRPVMEAFYNVTGQKNLLPGKTHAKVFQMKPREEH